MITCSAFSKKENTKCSLPTVEGSEHCFSHHPDREVSRAVGGKNSSNANRAIAALGDTMKPIARMLTDAIADVNSGDKDPRQLHAMAAGANALVKTAEFALLEERVAKLEETRQDKEIIDGYS